MPNIEKKIIRTVEQTNGTHRMVQAGDTVLVGVSGGPDSVALVHILLALAPNCSFQVAIAHLNHCLRQDESERDEAFVVSLAEKLDLPQITYVEDLVSLDGKSITVKRNLGNGWQEVKGHLPILLTVLDTANEPRVPRAKQLMRCKVAKCRMEVEAAAKDDPSIDVDAVCKDLGAKGLLIKQWDLKFLEADLQWCGRDGSPTKVHRIQSVVLAAQDTKEVEPTQDKVDTMIHELIVDHTIG